MDGWIENLKEGKSRKKRNLSGNGKTSWRVQQTKWLIQSRTGICPAEPQIQVHFNTLSTSSQMCSWKQTPLPLPWEQLLRGTFFTESAPHWHSEKAFGFNDANQENSEQYPIVHKPDVPSHWFERLIYPNTVWCPRFTEQWWTGNNAFSCLLVYVKLHLLLS